MSHLSSLPFPQRYWTRWLLPALLTLSACASPTTPAPTQSSNNSSQSNGHSSSENTAETDSGVTASPPEATLTSSKNDTPSPISTQPDPVPSTSEGSASPDPSLSSASAQTRLELAQNQLDPGVSFDVHFEIEPKDKLDSSAWVGIIPAEIPHGDESENDQFDLAYAPLGEHLSGTLVFNAPESPGKYELRLFDTDNNGHELYSLPFEVVGQTQISGNQLILDKSIYAPGENLQVKVSIRPEDKADETAWVGVIPSDVPHGDEATNDQYDVAYQYMGKYLAGTMIFKAPTEPGLYDLRLNSTDDQGVELAFVSFMVR